MTNPSLLKPDLGRYGVWTGGPVSPEQAKEIERLGYGAVWVGASPAAGLAFVEPILERTENLTVATGDRQYLERAGRRGRRVLPPHRKSLPRAVFAGADHVTIQVLGGMDELLPTLTELAGPLGLTAAG